MLNIGGVYVPRDLLDKIIHSELIAAIGIMFDEEAHLLDEEGGNYQPMPDTLRATLEAITDPYPNAIEYLIAVVQLQIDKEQNMTQGEVQQSEEFETVAKLARYQGDVKLATIIKREAKELGIDPSENELFTDFFQEVRTKRDGILLGSISEEISNSENRSRGQ